MISPRTTLCVLLTLTLGGAPAAQGDLSADRYRMEVGQPPVRALRLADVNGDGLLDLIRLAEQGLSILLQDEVGRFRPGSGPDHPPPAGTFFSDLATGSFPPGGVPNSQLPDVAILGGDGQVEILRNMGPGGLHGVSPSPVSPPFNAPASQVLVADLDGLLGDDVLVLLDGAPPLIFLADGAGGFVDATFTHGPLTLTVPGPRGVLADFDGDQDLDLVVSSLANPPVLLLNDGTGIFTLVLGAFPPTVLPAVRVLALDVVGDALPDLVFGLVGPSAPMVLENLGGAFAPLGVVQSFAYGGTRELLAGDVDGDGTLDLVALQDDGALLLGRGLGGGSFAAAEGLLPAGPRGAVAMGDLEGDGDLDLCSGGVRLEDQVLLGNGRGAFFDTESVDFPIGPAPRDYLGALVDVDRDRELDLVLYHRDGRPRWFANDGSARFAEADSAALPTLPGGAVYRSLHAASVRNRDRSDLLVLANPGAAGPLRILVNQGGSYVDQTALRWPGLQVPDAFLLEPGLVCTTRAGALSELDDLVLADSSGHLHLAENAGGTYALVPGAFPGPPLRGPSRILIGDLNGDQNCDVLALQIGGTPRVYLNSGSGRFSELASPVPPGHMARDGELGDLNGDKILDLILVPTQPRNGLTVLRGNGAGFFSDVTMRTLPQQPDGHITDLVLSRTDSGARLLVATDNTRDQILESGPTGFELPQPLPFRGSIQTSAMLTADLDLDGDTDVVTLRRETLPGLLRNSSLHLSQTGVSQSGRALSLRVVAPPATSAVFVFLGSAIPPFDLVPFGLLRLSSPALLVQFGLPPGNRDLTLNLPLPPLLGTGEVPLQAAFLDPLSVRVRLSNLEFAVFTDH